MSICQVNETNSSKVLGKALLNAGKALGLSQDETGEIIGKARTSIFRNGINPDSKEGELSILLIRVFRSLFVLVGDDNVNMKHWMKTQNSHLRGIPAQQIKKITGLLKVVEYLDSMRGKV